MEKTNEMHTAETGFLNFDPIVVVQDVLKRWLLIVLVVLAVGVVAYVATDLQYEPVYQTRTTFVVSNRSSSSTVYNNLSSTSELAGVFGDLLNSSVLRKTILRELQMSHFDGTITVTAVPDTNLLTMTVTASDPRTAFLVSRALIDHHEELTYKIVNNVVLEVLQSPTVPMRPMNSADSMGQMKRMMLVAALAVSLALGCSSFLRDAVRSGKEARKKLDCSYLGEIPHERKNKTLLSRLRRRKSSILITSPLTSFRFVETMRKLRRRVEQHMHGGKVLMITSLLENEGKSTVAANLALAMAQKHTRVLLIDCDLRKPACYALLDQKMTGPGLRDFLTDKAKMSEVMLRYRDTNLFVMLERKGNPNSGDLISAAKMQALLQWARKEFDFVVVDMPPMSVVSDAEVMMELADASLLVVRQNAAQTPAINKVIAALDSGKAKLLGCVLNNVYSTALSSGQGYGYGYGYGGYGKYGYYGSYGKKSSGK